MTTRARAARCSLLLACLASAAGPAWAQRLGQLPSVSPDVTDRARVRYLLGDDSVVRTGSSPLLRSASSLFREGTIPGTRHFSVLAPDLLFEGNTGFPYSYNDGALWSGKGGNGLVRAGVMAEWSRVRLVIAPEVVYSTNRPWVAFLLPIYYGPIQYPDRSLFSAPWYRLPRSIDNPWRFGPNHYARLEPGQSSITARVGGAAEIGVSSENEWWGPGIRNALVLSNNAPGFPHVFARTRRPLGSRIGTFDLRWILGGLAESAFFDTSTTNNRQSFSAAAAVWRPPATSGVAGLSVGIARAVYAPAGDGWRSVAARPLDFLAGTNRPDNVADADSLTMAPGRDEINSLFAQWAFPGAGFEVYGEWARTELPRSVRDFLLFPDHTRGYTVGLQWLRASRASHAHWRVQAEATNLEQGASFQSRPEGIWYTSRAVPQGYTHRGQVIGAAIGPGASSQWIGADYLAQDWSAGVVGQRIRWNNDALYYALRFPSNSGNGYCEHDVTLSPGFRGTFTSRLGAFAGELLLQNRLNYFFQNASGCPRGLTMRDLRNKALSIRWSP